MHTIVINNRTVHWSLRHSARRRRTFQIRLLGVDQLEVTAPLGASTAKIEEVLQTKSGWILRQIRRLELNAKNHTNASLTHGATLLFQGEPHSLLLLADGGKKPHVSYAPCTITLHLNELVG